MQPLRVGGIGRAKPRPGGQTDGVGFIARGSYLDRFGRPTGRAAAGFVGDIEIAILFGEFKEGVFSDCAKRAIANAGGKLFQPDWKERVFNKPR